MRPAQNKRIRGRSGGGNGSGRKGPNPLTRSYESNGPDVKIRGTAQTVAEKYLQLARDAQSSGNTVMAESLLQHAEHYFRLIAAAQQQTPNSSGRQSYEAEVDLEDDDDDFAGLPDRFAPLSERLPQTSFEPQQQPPRPHYQQAPQPHFTPPPVVQPPQPFEERPFGGEPRHERQGHERQGHERQGHERQGRNDRFGRDRGRDRGADRGFDRTSERNADTGERGQPQGFDRNRERNRFQQRVEPPPPEVQTAPRAAEDAIGLPAFITAPIIGAPTRSTGAEQDAPGAFPGEERGAERRHEGGDYHLASRRRRRPQSSMDEANGGAPAADAPQLGELPLGD